MRLHTARLADGCVQAGRGRIGGLKQPAGGASNAIPPRSVQKYDYNGLRWICSLLERPGGAAFGS